MNLMENVISFTFAALALVAILAMFNTSAFLGTRSQNQIHAEQILQELQEFYAPDLPKLTDGTYALAYQVDSTQVRYDPVMNLSTYSNDPTAPVRRLDIQVSWTYRGQSFTRQRVRLLCTLPR